MQADELREHRRRVLVVEDRDDCDQVAEALADLRQRLDERRDPLRVVRAVDERERIGADDLQAARDAHIGGGSRDGLAVEPSQVGLRRGARGGEVPPLKRPQRTDRRAGVRAGMDDPRASLRRDLRGDRGGVGVQPEPSTSVAPGWTTSSFSRAIASTVGPSQRVCSRPTLVSTCTFEGITLVASKRPPRPASITATSTPRRASSENAAAVSASNWVTWSSASALRSTSSAACSARSTAAANAAGSRSASSIRIRSQNETRCGERYAPVLSPWRARIAAIIRVVDDLPFVPTT